MSHEHENQSLWKEKSFNCSNAEVNEGKASSSAVNLPKSSCFTLTKESHLPRTFPFPQRIMPGCTESEDFVQLLGGNGIDTSKLLPITDICTSFTGPSKISLFADLQMWVHKSLFGTRFIWKYILNYISIREVQSWSFWGWEP